MTCEGCKYHLVEYLDVGYKEYCVALDNKEIIHDTPAEKCPFLLPDKSESALAVIGSNHLTAPLSPQEKASILNRLPENQRNLALQRINLAESRGVYSIGLWTGERLIDDLVGVDPKTHMLIFLTEPKV